MVHVSGGLQRGRLFALSMVLVFVLASCGSDESTTDAGTAPSSVDDAVADSDDDEDHQDEDGDHDDGDHDDEDHDDGDHDDEDHDDDGESSGGLGAHEHGVAELSVAWSEGDVVVDLISPTYNIFGFEHEPSTDEQRALVADRTAVLAEPSVVALNEEAGCELAAATDTEVEFEGSHAELTASWLFECENPDEIKQLDVGALFAEFPNLEDIDAQWASPSAQSASELSPSATVLDLG